MEHCFLCTALADDTTFFLKDAQSIENLFEIIKTFALFIELKPNLTKCEIAGIEAPKGVQVAVNFLKVVSNMQSVLKL